MPISIHFEFQIIFELGTIAKKNDTHLKKKDTIYYYIYFEFCCREWYVVRILYFETALDKFKNFALLHSANLSNFRNTSWHSCQSCHRFFSKIQIEG